MSISWLDVQVGLRMLTRYKGLTLAGGLALAIAIGLGAGWYDVMRDQLHPTLPLPGGDRLVEVEVRNAASNATEFRVLHDFLTWRRDVHVIEELSAYRTLDRNLILDHAPAGSVRVAEITASAFRVSGVPPLLGRSLIDADEQAGAPPVVVLGHGVWRQQFGGRPDAVGRTLQLGRGQFTVVGVMPEGFAFPEDHNIWVPLQLRPSGYVLLEGPAVRVFGRLAPGTQPGQATAEIAALTSRMAATSPATHQHLRPRVLPYGAKDLGGESWINLAITHGPILLILIVACANVGTLVYARTATREAEIAVRHALGASRARIVGQLFVEALVLAAVAAGVGLLVADLLLRWAFAYLALGDGLPFWIRPGLKFATTIYAALLAVVAAGIVGVLPAIKATGRLAQLRTAGGGGATLRFGKVWTTAMIAQVALTVFCIVPATEVAGEAVRDRLVRRQFPAAQYLAVEIAVDRDAPARDGEASADRVARFYGEFERRLTQEAAVLAITFADRLPGMGASVRRAQVELSRGADPILISNLWVAAVGPSYFETFDRPILSGRRFRSTDLAADSVSIIVNEAFARLYTPGISPVGLRVRYADSGRADSPLWFEIIGMVRDIGMTPTDFGEAPYMYRAASPTTASPLMVGVRLAVEPSALAARVREIAASVDPDVRLSTVQPLDEVVWSHDAPQLAVSGGIAGVVLMGLFLSAAGIFSLMSVSVARRTREIGLRTALGASPGRVLAGIFSRALLLIGSGIVAGSFGIVLLSLVLEDVSVGWVARELLITSTVMLTVGLLGCVAPARRALRISPAEALKDA